MRFASLGSGSRGNATLIESGDTRLLLDCGFAARELERRLAMLEVPVESVDAILVTHEHQDHVKGLGPMARRYGLPVWITHGTLRQARCGELPESHLIRGHQDPFRIGSLDIHPFSVPHDAREPIQFIFADGSRKLGILTDTGSITPHIVEMLSLCDALCLECNHDSEMLARGPYPPALQRRVGGRLGHLSNGQAADLLERLDHDRLSYLLAAHLSQQNNHPERVMETLLGRLPGLDGRLATAMQDSATGWIEI